MKLPPSGLIAAPHTPFDSAGQLMLETIPRLAALLEGNHVSGAFVCGTTGEGASLTTEERRSVAEAWRKSSPANLSLIVHIGHHCLETSCELARHAESIKADAIATVAPSFYKPIGVEELVDWCAAAAAAAPGLPFYYYHMPSMTGVDISAANFLARAHDRIPTLAGVKFTDENLMDYARASRVCPERYELYFGRDEIFLAGLAFGARGAVGSTYNFAAPLYHRIMRAFDEGRWQDALACQTKAIELVTLLNAHGGLSAGKAMMKIIGIDCGPVRLPLQTMPSRQESSLRTALDQIGFHDFAMRSAAV